MGADVLFKAPGATSRPLLDDSGTVKHPMANSTVSTHWPFGALGPRIHNFPISARFRARRIVTRAGCRQRRAIGVPGFVFLPGQGFAAGSTCCHGDGLGSLGGACLLTRSSPQLTGQADFWHPTGWLDDAGPAAGLPLKPQTPPQSTRQPRRAGINPPRPHTRTAP